MTMHVKDAGAWKAVTALSVRDAGAWKPVQAGYVRDNGAWKQFYAVDTGGGGGGGGETVGAVSISPSPAEGMTITNDTRNGPWYVSVQNVVATPTGFTGTLTYSWTRTSGPSSQGAFSASGTSTSTASFSASLPLGTYTETWRCTISNSAGSAYADVTVSLGVEYDSGN